MIHVDWSQVELRPHGYRSRPNKRKNYYACVRDQCGRTYWLRATDARRAAKHASSCKRCHCRAAVRKGYAATRDKYRMQYALECVAAYRLAHPSQPEKTVKEWLDEHAISYIRQRIFRKKGWNFIDGQIAFEVNGYHHQQHGQARDARLRELWSGPVVFVDAVRVERSTPC